MANRLDWQYPGLAPPPRIAKVGVSLALDLEEIEVFETETVL